MAAQRPTRQTLTTERSTHPPAVIALAWPTRPSPPPNGQLAVAPWRPFRAAVHGPPRPKLTTETVNSRRRSDRSTANTPHAHHTAVDTCSRRGGHSRPFIQRRPPNGQHTVMVWRPSGGRLTKVRRRMVNSWRHRDDRSTANTQTHPRAVNTRSRRDDHSSNDDHRTVNSWRRMTTVQRPTHPSPPRGSRHVLAPWRRSVANSRDADHRRADSRQADHRRADSRWRRDGRPTADSPKTPDSPKTATERSTHA